MNATSVVGNVHYCSKAVLCQEGGNLGMKKRKFSSVNFMLGMIRLMHALLSGATATGEGSVKEWCSKSPMVSLSMVVKLCGGAVMKWRVAQISASRRPTPLSSLIPSVLVRVRAAKLRFMMLVSCLVNAKL